MSITTKVPEPEQGLMLLWANRGVVKNDGGNCG